MSQPSSGTSHSKAAASAGSPDEDWASVADPNERRKIQNRIAQRKFRDKAREQKEDAERLAENQRQAGGSYSSAEPSDLDTGSEEGLPWGSLSLRHVVSTGRSKEQSSGGTSGGAARSQAGGSSR